VICKKKSVWLANGPELLLAFKLGWGLHSASICVENLAEYHGGEEGREYTTTFLAVT
jgi:hypothetical protein